MGEGGNLILIRVLGLQLLLRALGKVHVDGVGIVRHDQTGSRDGNPGRRWVGNVGQEDAAPLRGVGASAHVLDVKHNILEVFVKYPRLNFKGGLRTPQPVLEAGERRRGHGPAVGHRQQPCGDGKNGDDADKHPRAEATGAHRGDLAVGGKAAEADEDSDEQAHGNGDGAGNGQGEQKEFGHTGQGSAVTNDDLKQSP